MSFQTSQLDEVTTFQEVGRPNPNSPGSKPPSRQSTSYDPNQLRPRGPRPEAAAQAHGRGVGEYQQIVATTERQFSDEERDIESRQAELDTAQALIDRRRKALRRKRAGFSKMLDGWKSLDVEVATGKSSRSDAAADDESDEGQDERTEPAAEPGAAA
jgi:hypothetical protein